MLVQLWRHVSGLSTTTRLRDSYHTAADILHQLDDQSRGMRAQVKIIDHLDAHPLRHLPEEFKGFPHRALFAA